MADLRFGIAFQTERLALIREIARNLVAGPGPATGTNPAGRVAPTTEPDAAGVDDALLADRLAPREGQPPSPAAQLAGMRPPRATFLEPEVYRQVLAELTASDPLFAAMGGDGGWPEAGTAADTDLVFPEAATEVDGALTDPASPTASTKSEAAPSLAVRGEALAAAATAPGAEAGSTPAAVPADFAANADLSVTDLPSADVPVTAGSAEAMAMDARAATESVIERALTSLGLGEGATAPATMRGELGGIIASFILNAHFQPGWPPLRPVQDPEAKSFVAQLARDPKLSKDDLAMLTYLANFGLNRTQLARILKLVAAATNRSKLLQAIAQLFANVGTVLGALHAEIEALADEIKDMRAGRSRRERLTLR